MDCCDVKYGLRCCRRPRRWFGRANGWAHGTRWMVARPGRGRGRAEHRLCGVLRRGWRFRVRALHLGFSPDGVVAGAPAQQRSRRSLGQRRLGSQRCRATVTASMRVMTSRTPNELFRTARQRKGMSRQRLAEAVAPRRTAACPAPDPWASPETPTWAGRTREPRVPLYRSSRTNTSASASAEVAGEVSGRTM